MSDDIIDAEDFDFSEWINSKGVLRLGLQRAADKVINAKKWLEANGFENPTADQAIAFAALISGEIDAIAKEHYARNITDKLSDIHATI